MCVEFAWGRDSLARLKRIPHALIVFFFLCLWRWRFVRSSRRTYSGWNSTPRWSFACLIMWASEQSSWLDENNVREPTTTKCIYMDVKYDGAHNKVAVWPTILCLLNRCRNGWLSDNDIMRTSDVVFRIWNEITGLPERQFSVSIAALNVDVNVYYIWMGDKVPVSQSKMYSVNHVWYSRVGWAFHKHVLLWMSIQTFETTGVHESIRVGAATSAFRWAQCIHFVERTRETFSTRAFCFVMLFCYAGWKSRHTDAIHSTQPTHRIV